MKVRVSCHKAINPRSERRGEDRVVFFIPANSPDRGSFMVYDLGDFRYEAYSLSDLVSGKGEFAGETSFQFFQYVRTRVKQEFLSICPYEEFLAQPFGQERGYKDVCVKKDFQDTALNTSSSVRMPFFSAFLPIVFLSFINLVSHRYSFSASFMTALFVLPASFAAFSSSEAISAGRLTEITALIMYSLLCITFYYNPLPFSITFAFLDKPPSGA